MDQSFTKYEYLTLYLVNCDARPSCLFLNNEYTKKLESNIKKYFPNLKVTHSPFFGDFVSKQYLNITDHTSSNDVGIILGYPSDDIKYTEIDFNKDTYGTSIMITIDDVTISLLDTKTQNSIIDKMTSIMDIFTQKLLDKECYYSDNIKNIYTDESIIHAIDYYCEKLLKKETLTCDDEYNIFNFIGNIFNNRLSQFPFNYKNDFHIGIVIGLLLRYKNDHCEIFYGPQYGKCKETKRMIEINDNYANDLVDILEFTG